MYFSIFFPCWKWIHAKVNIESEISSPYIVYKFERAIVIELVFAIFIILWASESSSWNFQTNRDWYIDEMANMHAAGVWQLVSKLFHLIFFSYISSSTKHARYIFRISREIGRLKKNCISSFAKFAHSSFIVL